MKPFLALAAGGAVSWLLRAALIVLPSTHMTNRVGDRLRHIGPAAFSALGVTALTSAAHTSHAAWWPFALAAVTTTVTARLKRNLVLALAAGAAITLLTTR